MRTQKQMPHEERSNKQYLIWLTPLKHGEEVSRHHTGAGSGKHRWVNNSGRKKHWGSKRKHWGNKRKHWGNKRKHWGNKRKHWGNKRKHWGNKRKHWGNKRKHWGNKRKQSRWQRTQVKLMKGNAGTGSDALWTTGEYKIKQVVNISTYK